MILIYFPVIASRFKAGRSQVLPPRRDCHPDFNFKPFFMTCYVYFLFSATTRKFYVGVSNDVADRLRRHNNAESLSTKNGVPWKLVHTIVCEHKSLAMQLELKIKKRGIRRFLSDIDLFPSDSVPL